MDIIWNAIWAEDVIFEAGRTMELNLIMLEYL